MRIEEGTLDLPAEEGARVIALGLLAEATDAAAALAAGQGKEPLHDFRVAVRRLRSALRSYRPWLTGRVKPRHEQRLKRVAASTNEARDAEVQLAWLGPLRAELSSPAHLRGHDVAVARFETRLHGGPDTARVVAKLDRVAGRLRRRLERSRRGAATAAGPEPSFGAAVASLVEEHVGLLVARIEAIRDAADVETAHRARIEGKRLRYLLEPLRGCSRADASDVVARLKQLQDVLGELHDAHVLGVELGAALTEASAERARLVHEAAMAVGGAAPLRGRLRSSPRPGLLALIGLVRARRDALFARLERDWRAGGLGDLAAQAQTIAEALQPRAPSPSPGP
jgi:CHAD domain-containing protein